MQNIHRLTKKDFPTTKVSPLENKYRVISLVSKDLWPRLIRYLTMILLFLETGKENKLTMMSLGEMQFILSKSVFGESSYSSPLIFPLIPNVTFNSWHYLLSFLFLSSFCFFFFFNPVWATPWAFCPLFLCILRQPGHSLSQFGLCAYVLTILIRKEGMRAQCLQCVKMGVRWICWVRWRQ